ncbi:hypothetical protein D3C78_1208370 [compost metagenome]
MRTCSVAVRARMSLALAVSCTPGSCTTMRLGPACWITGSATPSSLTRLCRVVMFCDTASLWMRVISSGFSARLRRNSWSSLLKVSDGRLRASLSAAAVSVSWSRSCTSSVVLPVRLMAP